MYASLSYSRHAKTGTPQGARRAVVGIGVGLVVAAGALLALYGPGMRKALQAEWGRAAAADEKVFCTSLDIAPDSDRHRACLASLRDLEARRDRRRAGVFF